MNITVEPLKVVGKSGDPEGWCYYTTVVYLAGISNSFDITPELVNLLGPLGFAGLVATMAKEAL